MKTHTLHTGEVVDGNSEAWRHHCEAVTVLKMPTGSREGYLQLVRARRGDIEMRRLRNTVQSIWIDRTARELIELERKDLLESERRLQRIGRDAQGERYRAAILKRMQEIISTTIPSSDKTERAA
jgi:hypothetical protein